MKTIYKYPVTLDSVQPMMMPCGAQIIHAGLDPSGIPCLWAVVEPNIPHEPRTILVVGTGGVLSPGIRTHLGSFVRGPFVWHLFE